MYSLAHLDGRQWNRLRTKFRHFVDFDCSITCSLSSSLNTDAVHAEIRESFIECPDWSVDFPSSGHRSDEIHAYTKAHLPTSSPISRCKRFSLLELSILDREQLMNAICGSSEVCLDCDVDEDELPNDDPVSSLLVDRAVFNLRSLEIGGEAPSLSNTLLITFLAQLIPRAPNLARISIVYTADFSPFDKIICFLRTFKQPLSQVRECEINCSVYDDESYISDIAFYFPLLTSVVFPGGCAPRHVSGLINLCLTYMHHLLYLEIDISMCIFLPDSFVYDHDWLKQNTVLGSTMSEKLFKAELAATALRMWF